MICYCKVNDQHHYHHILFITLPVYRMYRLTYTIIMGTHWLESYILDTVLNGAHYFIALGELICSV